MHLHYCSNLSQNDLNATAAFASWLGGRKGIWPVKAEWWGSGMVVCLEHGANDLHMAQLMPLPPYHLLLQ